MNSLRILLGVKH